MRLLLVDSVTNSLVATNIPDELYHLEYPLESLLAADVFLARRMFDDDPMGIRTTHYYWAKKLMSGTVMGLGHFGKVIVAVAFGPKISSEVDTLKDRLRRMPLEEAWRWPIAGKMLLDDLEDYIK